MAGEADDPDDAAARLEAALERIARLAASGRATAAAAQSGTAAAAALASRASRSPVEEIAARLDGLIDRLRAALSSSSGGKPG